MFLLPRHFWIPVVYRYIAVSVRTLVVHGVAITHFVRLVIYVSCTVIELSQIIPKPPLVYVHVRSNGRVSSILMRGSRVLPGARPRSHVSPSLH